MAGEAGHERLDWLRGTILDSVKRTETQIWSEGGGGTVGPGGGSVSAPQIRSRNTTIQEVWLIEEVTGEEKAFSYRGVDIPLRMGNAVSIGLLAGGGHVVLVNHATGDASLVASPAWVATQVGDLAQAGIGYKVLNSALSGCITPILIGVLGYEYLPVLLDIDAKNAGSLGFYSALAVWVVWAAASWIAESHRKRQIALAEARVVEWINGLVALELQAKRGLAFDQRPP